MTKSMRSLTMLGTLAFGLGACQQYLAPQNPLAASPFRPVPSGPGVFETFEAGPMKSVWYGSAGAPDSIIPAITNEDFYTGGHSLKYTVSVNPSGWGSVGQDLDSNFGVVDATGKSQMTLRVRASSAFTLSTLLFETGSGGMSCAEGGTGQAWVLPPQHVPAAAGWQEVTVSIASPTPFNKNSCVTAGSFNKAAIKTLELDFGPTSPATVLNATIYVDDIVFEP